MTEIKKLIKNNYFWIFLSTLSIVVSFFGEQIIDKPSPKIAVYLGLAFLTLTLLPPLLKSIKLLKNYKKPISKLIKLKRDLGITSGVLFIFHTIFVWKKFADFQLSFLFEIEIITGTLALLIFIILLATSNQYSIKKLKTNWRKIQSLVWLSVPLLLIHPLLTSTVYHEEIPKLTVFFGILIIIPPIFYFIKEKNKERSYLLIVGIILSILILGVLNLIKNSQTENTTQNQTQSQIETPINPETPDQNTNFKLEEVNKHNNPKDCWLIYKNKVYGFTNYLEKHPPGSESIIPFCGKNIDSTENTHRPPYSKPELEEIFEENYLGELE
jgi:DMSO/TMAO reductase YedYZ heme-binding membrane subunit